MDCDEDCLEPPTKRFCVTELLASHVEMHPKETRLRDVYSDCLTQLLFFLPASLLGKLVCTGDKRLIDLVYQSTTCFDWRLSHPSESWPSIIGRLHNLTHLRVFGSAFCERKHNPKVLNVDWWTLPASLKSLHLEYVNLFSVPGAPLTSAGCVQLPTSPFANLNFICLKDVLIDPPSKQAGRAKSLVLQQTVPPHAVFHQMLDLATKLQDLSFLWQSPVDASFLAHIPKSVESLAISQRMHPGSDLSGLPLTRLKAALAVDQSPVIVPNTLTHLSLNLNMYHGTYQPPMTALPPLLTKLNVRASTETLAYFLRGIINPVYSITHFKLRLVAVFTVETEHLTEIARVMPNLKSLRSPQPLEVASGWSLAALPRSITELSDVFVMPSSCWHHIPSACRILRASSFGVDSFTMPTVRICDKSISRVHHLPSRIDSVALHGMHVLPSHSWLGLTFVHVVLPGGVSFPAFFTSLPSSVTTLQIKSYVKSVPMEACYFTHLTALTALSINSCSPNKCSMLTEAVGIKPPISFNEWVDCLPRTLTLLRMRIVGDWQCSEGLGLEACNWPPHLKHLNVYMLQSSYTFDAMEASIAGLDALRSLRAAFCNLSITSKVIGYKLHIMMPRKQPEGQK